VGKSFHYVGCFFLSCILTSGSAKAVELTFTKEEAETLKEILSQDKMLKALTAEQKGLQKLNNLASLVIAGPVTLALDWNVVPLSAWGKANPGLISIGKGTVCTLIADQINDQSPNVAFFTALEKIRGCSD